ncbi:hypothetical protein MYX76_14850 [Desulfobacterota bacterium AH_259_B03_O07]|nr:hypothetical protein [Desulfobacterota bacterium AH_259_B03_O07]
MSEAKYDINKVKKTYRDMRNYFKDINELSKSESESLHAQYVIDALLKWEGIHFKTNQKIPISFKEYLILYTLLPNENNNYDPDLVNGLWAYQYYLINIGEKMDADKLDWAMSEKIGIEQWNETKKQQVMTANMYKTSYQKLKESSSEEKVETPRGGPYQLAFDFVKERRVEEVKEKVEIKKEERFDMIKFLEKEKKEKSARSYSWMLLLIIIVVFISTIIFLEEKGFLNEFNLLILLGAFIVIVIVIAFVISRLAVKRKKKHQND